MGKWGYGSVSESLSYRIVVAGLLAPHECGLEFGELVGTQFVAAQDQTDDVLGEEREAAQVEHFIAVLVDEFEHLLHETLGALVLDVSLGRCQQGAYRVHIDAALHEASTGTTQFFESVIVGRIHYAQQCPRLQRNASGVDVLD